MARNKALESYAKELIIEGSRKHIYDLIQSSYEQNVVKLEKGELATSLSQILREHLEIDRLTNKYIDYIFKLVSKYRPMAKQNRLSYDIISLLFRLTFPKLASELVAEINNFSKIKLIESHSVLIISFKEAVLKVNEKLFHKHEVRKYKGSILDPDVESEIVMEAPRINSFLKNIFDDYEAFLLLFIDKLDKAKRLILKLDERRNKDSVHLQRTIELLQEHYDKLLEMSENEISMEIIYSEIKEKLKKFYFKERKKGYLKELGETILLPIYVKNSNRFGSKTKFLHAVLPTINSLLEYNTKDNKIKINQVLKFL